MGDFIEVIKSFNDTLAKITDASDVSYDQTRELLVKINDKIDDLRNMYFEKDFDRVTLIEALKALKEEILSFEKRRTDYLSSAYKDLEASIKAEADIATMTGNNIQPSNVAENIDNTIRQLENQPIQQQPVVMPQQNDNPFAMPTPSMSTNTQPMYQQTIESMTQGQASVEPSNIGNYEVTTMDNHNPFAMSEPIMDETNYQTTMQYGEQQMNNVMDEDGITMESQQETMNSSEQSMGTIEQSRPYVRRMQPPTPYHQTAA